MLLADLLLLLHCSGLISNIALETLHVLVDVLHLVLNDGQLGVGFDTHVSNLILILSILLLDRLNFLVPICNDLLNSFVVPVDQRLIVLLLFVDLSLLVVHLFLVLFSLEQDLILVLLLDFLDGSQEVLVFTLFLGLKL